MNQLDKIDYSPLGRKVKNKLASFRQGGLHARLQNPATLNFVHDIDVWTKFDEFSDQLVGKLATLATADNLKALGYRGARSNSGETVIPIITAAIHEMKAKLGNDKVMSSDSFYDDHSENSTSHWKPRMIKNTTEVRETFCRYMDQIVLELLAL